MPDTDDDLAFLRHGGELGERIAAFDWSATALGPIPSWPAALRTTVAMLVRSPVPIVTLWGEPGVLIYNDAYSVFAGGRHPELLGMEVRDGWPEVADFNDAVVKAVFRSGQTLSYKDQALILHRPGRPEQAWMNLDYSPVIDECGSALGVIAIVVETTERVVAETTAAQHHERLQLALSAGNGVGTWDWDVPADRVVSDGRFARLYGVDAETAKSGATLADYFASIHPDDVADATAAVDRTLRTGEDFYAEYRLLQPDGSVRWVAAQGRCTLDPDGRPLRFPGVSFDITDRKAVEGQLRRLNETLEAEVEQRTRERDRIWASSPDLMGVADHAGYFVRSNPAWFTLLGWSEAEVAATPFLDLVHPDDRAATAIEVANQQRGIPMLRFENRFRAKDGSYRWQQWVAVPEGDHVYCVARDVTEAREKAIALEAAEEALRQSQKMEAVGQLTGGIAHDFNNLLQAISGSLEIIQRRAAQGRVAELDRFITGASTAAARAAALTHRLLAFSRRQPLDPRPVRANPLVASIEDLLRRTIGQDVELELVLAGGLWMTLCDPNQLENALLNLVINARDAMPNGGKLTIETCNAHLDSAYAASQREVQPGQYVCICVTDTGVGMSAETATKAFDPFFTTKPIGQGTGLGLSMIYGFARQSEGYAKIYSEAGKGTTVKLYLPRHRGPAEREEPIPEMTAAHGTDAGEIVLVVEDEPVVRSLIVETLGELGYRAMEAADGPRGLEILQSDRRIDLLVTDIGLPGINGRQMVETARLVRPDLKVLFMTGYAENAALASGFLEHGMTMITKPFAMEALAARIRGMIEGEV